MLHSFYDGPGLLAAMHTAAALGAAEAMIEWRVFDLEAQLYADALAPRDGRMSVPQKSGLGVDPESRHDTTLFMV
jgi:L-alanine-DL-glutamate epimerase-like enolase superfamily enzyme